MNFVHGTAIVDDNVTIGSDTRIGHFTHIQPRAGIGESCSPGQNMNVSNNVTLGNGVKEQNSVSIYEGVTIEDYVFCGPSCVFTNDLMPKAQYPKNHKYLPTIICHDATLRANCTIVCRHEMGYHATIAAGAVVACNVKPHALR